MGNVNGREEDGLSGSVPEEEEDEEEEEDGMLAAAAAAASSSGLNLNLNLPHHSPVPLKFAPQPPVAPIQKPDELHIPNPSWFPEDDEISYEQGIPTMITWTHGAKEVAVEGSWDNWNSRKPLQRSGKDFSLIKVLPSGVYHFRFLVDGTSRYAPDIPWILDETGSFFNVLDLQDYVPEDIESISGFEPPHSPDGSYNNAELNQEDFAKEPPLVPPHLNLTLLNVPSLCSEVPPPSLSRPQHVVLNHLYMQKGKSGPSVVALGSTHRFKSKYVTVVLYKSL